MSHEKTIADLAYHLWHARGCPHGSSEIDWAEAERQVRGRPADRALDAPVPANGLTPSTAAARGGGAKSADKSAEKPGEKSAIRVAPDDASAAAEGAVTRTKKKTKR